MESNSKPEILRVHLGQALLKLFELGVNPLQFDFVEAPSRQLMDAAIEALELVGAILQNKITERGKWIAKLPIDPKFGAFLYQAIEDDIGIEAIILSACSGASSLFYRSGTEKEKNIADQRKIRFCHEGGDFMTMLNVFREWHKQPEKTKGQWCSENSVNGKVVRGIRETVNEVLNVLKKELGVHMKFVLKLSSNVDEKLQKMLFELFRQNICHYLGHEKAGYVVVQKDQNVQIFPASSLKSLGLQPNWIVIERVLKTSRDFASSITPVKDAWIKEALDNGLVKLDLDTIQRQKVEQVAFCEVGEKLYSEFVGLRYSELRKLETSIRQKCDGNSAVIEASKEYGEITVYTNTTNAIPASNMVKERLDTLKKKLKEETREQFLSTSKTDVKVILGAGVNIVDVLMPNEYRTVVVTVKDNSPSEKDIYEQFEKWGNVVSVSKFRYSKDRTKWGKVTYLNKEDAQRAVASVKENENVGAIPDKGFQPTKSPVSAYTMRAKLEWCRRPMFAFIRFSDSSLVKQACKASISIGGTCLRIRKNKTNASEIHITNLNSNTKEADLHKAIVNALSLSTDKIESIAIRRKNVKTSEDMLKSFKQSIEAKLNEYVKEGTYDLDLKTPKDNHVTYLAFISFSIPEEGLAAYAGINNTYKIDYEMVIMTPEFKTSVVIPKFVYPVYKATVDKLTEDLAKSLNVKCRLKELKNGNILVDIQSDNKETILQGKTLLRSAIEGKKYGTEDIDDIQRLFTLDGKRFVDIVKKQTDTVIIADARVFSLMIHGTEDDRKKAILMFIEYLNDQRAGTSKQVPLKGPDKPTGLMKELMLRYDFDLNKLKVESGLKYVELDRRRHILTMNGDLTAVDTATKNSSKSH